MPLKQRVTPEMILQAAFDVLKRDQANSGILQGEYIVRGAGIIL